MREHFPFFQQASQTARPTFFRCRSLGFRLDVSWDGKHARLLFVQRGLRTMLLVLVGVSWSKATDRTIPPTVLAYYKYGGRRLSVGKKWSEGSHR